MIICQKSMAECLTPGMCAPHGGCHADKSEWQSGYDEGRRMGTKHMYTEVDRLNRENERMRKALVTIRDESADLGACECAADALAESGKRERPC